MKLVDKANQYRLENPRLKGGYVVIFQGEAAGWTNSLERPEGWEPGCIAVSEDGKCYEAQGGDAYNGAKKWKLYAVTALCGGGV